MTHMSANSLRHYTHYTGPHHISLARSILELKSPEEIDSFVLNLSLGHLLGQHISAEACGDNNITHQLGMTLQLNPIKILL